MAQRYRIYAYSPGANQKQQSHDLVGDARLSDSTYSQLKSQEYAQRLNQQILLGYSDWMGSIEAYEHEENFMPFQLPNKTNQ